MGFIEKLGRIDNRVLYVLLVLVLLYPLVNPMGLPVSLSNWTKTSYAVIDSVPSGETVVIDFGYNIDGAPDVEPQLVAVLRHLFDKQVKIICVGLVHHGPMIAERLLAPWEAKGKKYGEDFVILGYLAGGETALAAYARDFKKAFPQDWRGNATDSLPLLANITSAGDTKLWLFFTDSSAEVWVRQISQYNIPIVGGLITVTAPQAEPFIHSGQLAGMLSGLRGAAEYENIMRAPGRAVASMDAQSMGHMLLIVFIICANLAYFAKRSREARP